MSNFCMLIQITESWHQLFTLYAELHALQIDQVLALCRCQMCACACVYCMRECVCMFECVCACVCVCVCVVRHCSPMIYSTTVYDHMVPEFNIIMKFFVIFTGSIYFVIRLTLCFGQLKRKIFGTVIYRYKLTH